MLYHVFSLINYYCLLSETRQCLDDLCIKHNVDCSSPRTTTRLLDKVRLKASFCNIIITSTVYKKYKMWHARNYCETFLLLGVINT